jgi:peptide/nickel transport system substrate-binding protein
VVVALPVEPESLMPYATNSAVAAEVQAFLFRMLADTNPDFGTFSPSVARSWEWSEDRKSLVMFLRDDVYWSDGVQLTAEDVAFTHDVARDSLVGWVTRSWKTHVTACEVLDRFTVRFDFDAVFLDQFRFAKEGWLLPKHRLQEVPREAWAQSSFGRQPVGCGPFVLERWEPGQRIILVRNEHYFDRPKPYLDRVVLEFVPESSTRVERLRAGTLDATGLVPRQADALRRDAASTGVRVLHVRGRSYDFIGYNSGDPLFAHVPVRQALTMAIDRQSLIEALCFGFAEIFEGPFPPMLWAYDPGQPVTPYDPEAARRLLAAEGWQDRDGDGWLDRDGERFEFTITTNSDNPLRMQAIVAVQAYWREIGVKAEVQALEMQTALKLRTERRTQAYFGGWSAGLSPSGTVQNLWSCDSRGERSNFTDFCDPRVDSLNALVAASPSIEAAQPLTHRIQRLIVAAHPYTWMYYEHTLVGVGPRLQGLRIDPRGAFLNMEDWFVPLSLQ